MKAELELSEGKRWIRAVWEIGELRVWFEAEHLYRRKVPVWRCECYAYNDGVQRWLFTRDVAKFTDAAILRGLFVRTLDPFARLVGGQPE